MTLEQSKHMWTDPRSSHFRANTDLKRAVLLSNGIALHARHEPTYATRFQFLDRTRQET